MHRVEDGDSIQVFRKDCNLTSRPNRTPYLIVIIFCHSSFVSSCVKTTIRFEESATVESLCAAYIKELLSGRGVCVCREQDAGFTTTFALHASRDPDTPPLNERDSMNHPLTRHLPAGERSGAKVLLHAYWAPTSRFWERIRGNMDQEPLLHLACSIAQALEPHHQHSGSAQGPAHDPPAVTNQVAQNQERT